MMTDQRPPEDADQPATDPAEPSAGTRPDDAEPAGIIGEAADPDNTRLTDDAGGEAEATAPAEEGDAADEGDDLPDADDDDPAADDGHDIDEDLAALDALDDETDGDLPDETDDTAVESGAAARNAGAVAAPRPEGERVAKVIARAGVASRRDAEVLIAEGRVSVNGVRLETPAVVVTEADEIRIDGEPIPSRLRTRAWLFHKPRGLVTTNRDPEGRPTVFDALPSTLPRVVTVGRLDINTEGLLILTNDGGLARVLELPATGWTRKYRARVHGDVDEKALASLREGTAVDGILYGPIEVTFERKVGDNAWVTIALAEGKNREVKIVLGSIGLQVTRLIRISFGPFQLGDLPRGEVKEIPTRQLKDQLGPRLSAEAGVDFDAPVSAAARRPSAPSARGKPKPLDPAARSKGGAGRDGPARRGHDGKGGRDDRRSSPRGRVIPSFAERAFRAETEEDSDWATPRREPRSFDPLERGLAPVDGRPSGRGGGDRTDRPSRGSDASSRPFGRREDDRRPSPRSRAGEGDRPARRSGGAPFGRDRAAPPEGEDIAARAPWSGDRDHGARSGDRDHGARSGGRDHEARSGGRDHEPRSGGRDHEARSGGRDHEPRSGGRDYGTRSGTGDREGRSRAGDRDAGRRFGDRDRGHRDGDRDAGTRFGGRDTAGRTGDRDRGSRGEGRPAGTRYGDRDGPGRGGDRARGSLDHRTRDGGREGGGFGGPGRGRERPSGGEGGRPFRSRSSEGDARQSGAPDRAGGAERSGGERSGRPSWREGSPAGGRRPSFRDGGARSGGGDRAGSGGRSERSPSRDRPGEDRGGFRPRADGGERRDREQSRFSGPRTAGGGRDGERATHRGRSVGEGGEHSGGDRQPRPRAGFGGGGEGRARPAGTDGGKPRFGGGKRDGEGRPPRSAGASGARERAGGGERASGDRGRPPRSAGDARGSRPFSGAKGRPGGAPKGPRSGGPKGRPRG